MNEEEVLTTLLVGVLVGLFLFVGVYVRVRRWSQPKPQVDDRYRPSHHGPPPSPLSGFDALEMADRLVDLGLCILVVAMITYGAIVAPRLRPILLVAVVTATALWWCWRRAATWLKRG